MHIQEGITKDKTWKQIAKEIEVSPTTVSREVLRNRIRDRSARYGKGVRRFCAVEKDCTVKGLCKRCHTRLCRVCQKVLCTIKCPHYTEASCERLVGPPYACNGCAKKASCFVERWVYDAKSAHRQAKVTLVSAREGIDLDVDEARELESWLSPLIKQGQTPEQIYLTHKDEIPFSIRTFYTYTHNRVFDSFNDFDLQRKVRYKKRAQKETSVPKDLTGREYKDFSKLPANLRSAATELDSVIGRVGGVAFMTMYLRSCQLMPVFLLQSCCQEAVMWVFNTIDTAVTVAEKTFSDIFCVLLADRGSELSCWDEIEDLGADDDANPNSKIYYCDPRRPDQKGALEGSHTYIREVLPKGTSFDELKEEDVRKLASHINSIPRPALHGKSPYQVACFLYGKTFVHSLGISYVAPDDIIRRPWLLDK
jgi:IS30 family transposase